MQRRFFDGRIKLFITWRTLELRERHAEFFHRADYRAIRSDSPHVCAFSRGDNIVVAVPRLTAKLTKVGMTPVGEVWEDSKLPIDSRGSFRNIFTGETMQFDGEPVRLAQVFSKFPVAVLERQ
jgi:(1->4)-alpha-D-glucan 1-alpha-D-glucosylmutase